MPSLRARDCKFANMDCGGKRDPLVARRALQLGRRVAVRTILALAGNRGWAHRKQLKSVESVDTRCNVYQSRWWEGTRTRWAKNKRRHSAPQVTLGGPAGRPYRSYLPPSSLLSAMYKLVNSRLQRLDTAHICNMFSASQCSLCAAPDHGGRCRRH